MAKFTSPIPLSMEYEGHNLTGPAGYEFRLPDSLRAAFDAEFGTRVHPTWVVEDEIGNGGGGGEHPNLATHVTLGLISSDHETVSDPHVQYCLDADLANHESAGHVHTHAESAVTNLVSDLSGKAATVHTHAESSVTNLVSDLAGKAASVHQHAYSTLTSIPGTFAPSAHSHVDGDLPAGLARDSEVSAAIVSHESTATHGGGGSLPAGLIVMWGGAVTAIPAGWLLCDGANGTPDLRSRFIKGAAAGSDPGATGGAATHTHAGHSNHVVTQPSAHTDVPTHTHPITDPGHVHAQQRFPTATGGSTGFTVDTSMSGTPAAANDTGSKVTGVSVNAPVGAVASQPHSGTAVDAHSAHDSPNSEPAYYALAFIQKS